MNLPTRRFKDAAMQRMYTSFRVLNGEGKLNAEGPTFSSGHEAYWHGRRGQKKNRYARNTLAYAAWAAGQDDRSTR